MADQVLTGPQDGNDPDPECAKATFEGPVPAILARTKAPNSVRARQPVDSNLLDGPYGGKSPQS